MAPEKLELLRVLVPALFFSGRNQCFVENTANTGLFYHVVYTN